MTIGGGTPLFNCPAITERMARDRFLEIHKYLHFVDNSGLIPPGDPGYDHLCKVQGVLTMIEERLLPCTTPADSLQLMRPWYLTKAGHP